MVDFRLFTLVGGNKGRDQLCALLTLVPRANRLAARAELHFWELDQSETG
jgi:hypothetical protein